MSSVVTPTAARVVRARAAAVSGVRMTVGVTTHRRPSASTSATPVGVGLVDHEGGGERGVEAGDADHAGLVAQLDEQAVGGTLEGGAGDDRGHGDDVVAAGGHGVVHTGHGQHRPDRHDRVGGGDHDRPGGGEGSITPGVGRAAPAPAMRTDDTGTEW